MSSSWRIPYGWNPDRQTFSSYRDNRHLITFGPTRSGKGATVIMQTLLLAEHSVVCIDPKGQNAAVAARRRRELGQDVHFLNPFDELSLGTSSFNPLAHLSITDRNIVADVAALAEALIVSNDKDPHWSDSARALVAALILHLIENRGRADARPVTLPVMRELLTQVGSTFTATIREMVASDYPFISQPAGRFAATTNEIANVISTAITQTAFLDDPALIDVLSGDDFRMADLKAKPMTLFLILPGRYMEAYSRFFRLLITSAIDQLTATRGGRRTLFILDEFATLQNLGAVAKAFGFAAGYNVQLWPFLQDLPQLKSIYGDRWESFLANAGLVQFFTPSDMTTAEYLRQRGGMTTREKASLAFRELTPQEIWQERQGLTESYTGESVPLLPPEMTMGISPTAQIVFFAGTHGPQQDVERLSYWDIPRLNGMYDPDPFHV